MSNTTIQIRKSGSSGNTPGALGYGELALNYVDGKLYYNDGTSISYFENSDSFSTISANGTLIIALTPKDILTVNPANAITVLSNSQSQSISIGLDENQISSFVRKTGDTMTGDLNISTANVDAKFIIVEDTLYSGLATRSATPLPNLIAQFTSNSATYVQVNQQNIGANGTADYVVTADVGSDTVNYIDLGMAGSKYDNLDANNSLGTSLQPLDGYLYVQGGIDGQLGGNLVLGTTHTGTHASILVGGVNTENVMVMVDSSNTTVYNNLIVNGNISGPTIISLEQFTQAAYNKANTGTSGGAFNTIEAAGYSNVYATTSNVLTLIGQTGIAIGTDPTNTSISIATTLIGASNVVVDYGEVADTIGAVTFDYGYV